MPLALRFVLACARLVWCGRSVGEIQQCTSLWYLSFALYIYLLVAVSVCICLCNSGYYLVFVGLDSYLRIWDTNTRQPLSAVCFKLISQESKQACTLLLLLVINWCYYLHLNMFVYIYKWFVVFAVWATLLLLDPVIVLPFIHHDSSISNFPWSNAYPLFRNRSI